MTVIGGQKTQDGLNYLEVFMIQAIAMEILFQQRIFKPFQSQENKKIARNLNKFKILMKWIKFLYFALLILGQIMFFNFKGSKVIIMLNINFII